MPKKKPAPSKTAKTSKPKAKKVVKAPAPAPAKKSAPVKAAPKKEIVQKQSGTASYEKKLQVMREDLMEIVHHKQEVDLTEQEVGDEADAATLSSERELMFELSDNERQQLDAIEAALRKIETGVYGRCEGCSKDIPSLRLQAIPQARYCIQCQARFETPSR
jgi:DnaK suppressor protein